jgi:glycosyltransferase involved in cell wall biosynthesis
MASGTGGPAALRVALVGTGALEIPPPGYGAVEEYIANLARELRVRGHQVEILNRRPPFTDVRAREIVSAALLPADLYARAFDIVHVHSPISAEALLLTRRPFVLTSHSRHWDAERPLDRLRRARDRWAVRRAAGVIALTPGIAQEFRRLRPGSPADRVVHAPFGVDTERFHPPPPGTERAGVIGLGVVVPHKRFDILAAASARAGLPASVIGRIADPSVVERARALLPGIRFLGEVERTRLPDLLAAARIFVHPSDSELASVATVQAMACGLPVVGSDQVSALVQHGETGFLVDHRLPFEERVAQTAEHVRRLATDEGLWRSFSECARAHALSEHAWSAVARTVEGLYRALAPPRGARTP